MFIQTLRKFKNIEYDILAKTLILEIVKNNNKNKFSLT